MKLKKLTALALSAVLGASMIAGCGSNSGSQGSAGSTAPAESSTTESSAAPAEGSSAVSDAGEAGSSTGGETAPVAWDGKNITVNVASEPQTIDPALNSAVDGAMMTLHMFEGLMK
ncbi:MAG TPA: hypothetical protein DF613_10385 [Lachnospiraceae bacterium]|nr:hypothetical protein [Lachnospiraceae bacterium]